MNENDKKIEWVNEIKRCVLIDPYDPEKVAKYVFLKSLDERMYLDDDTEWYQLIDLLRGMDAGEEFHYSRDEVLTLLQDYVGKLLKSR